MLAGLADTAAELIEIRLAGHEPARAVVTEVLGVLFGARPCSTAERDRLVAALLEIVGHG